MNVEFQTIMRRNKKAFLSEQCKELEENSRMRKTRSPQESWGNIKGTFHARAGTTKDRNSKDLTETEEVKKRWQEFTEELYEKKIFLMTLIT